MNLADTAQIVAALIAGWVIWTLSEYLLHRFAMHELQGRGLISREHLNHHKAPNWADFGWLAIAQWSGVALVGLIITVGIVAAIGPRGWIVGAGWVLGYVWYETFHARSHLSRPSRVFRRYDMRLRRHHMHHHFGHPMSNHGVTTALWDRVFGTFEESEVIRIPHAKAPRWLLGTDGALDERYIGGYVIVGDPLSARLRREKLAAARLGCAPGAAVGVVE